MKFKRLKTNASIEHIEILQQEVNDLGKQLKDGEITKEEHGKKIERIRNEVDNIKRDLNKLQRLGEMS